MSSDNTSERKIEWTLKSTETSLQITIKASSIFFFIAGTGVG